MKVTKKMDLEHVNQSFNESKIKNISLLFPNLHQVEHLQVYLRDYSFLLLSLLIAMFIQN